MTPSWHMNDSSSTPHGVAARLRLLRLPVLLSILILASHIPHASANGHGPVFALATPTNGKGVWSFDVGLMGRQATRGAGVMSRAMLGYGITPDVQISVSAPFVFSSAPVPAGRATAMMPATGNFEALGAWRFHRQGIDVGSRFESTAYLGLVVPGPQLGKVPASGLERSPGVYAAAATGLASRSHYVWGGVGYTAYGESGGDRRSNTLTYSLVWGYRPPSLRIDYPAWDWRLFVEMTGEDSSNIQARGIERPGTGGHQVFVGPTTLGIYKNYAIQGGIQFPVYRSTGFNVLQEQFRFALNLSYFF